MESKPRLEIPPACFACRFPGAWERSGPFTAEPPYYDALPGGLVPLPTGRTECIACKRSIGLTGSPQIVHQQPVKGKGSASDLPNGPDLPRPALPEPVFIPESSPLAHTRVSFIGMGDRPDRSSRHIRSAVFPRLRVIPLHSVCLASVSGCATVGCRVYPLCVEGLRRRWFDHVFRRAFRTLLETTERDAGNKDYVCRG